MHGICPSYMIAYYPQMPFVTRHFPHLAELAPPAWRSTSPVVRCVLNGVAARCGQSVEEMVSLGLVYGTGLSSLPYD